MNKPPRNKEFGQVAARQFGAEFQANPGSSRLEYLNDAAYYFGEDKEKFRDLDPEERTLCLTAFNEGVAEEKKLQQ